MEINHQTFGKIKFNYGWTKDISLEIFNKHHVLEINIDADEDAEFEINQEKAYIFFENHIDEIAKEVDVAILSYTIVKYQILFQATRMIKKNNIF